ncbi:MAG: hypothetical protein EZS28_024309 [Streblomastix strix]|uniref:Uncharacterized protein n=1 Tax=Streblomastix strix TaxID=222440 RepID=A0A5J4VCK1_9EUKA|nr:MAG: hypothetical protein EZS28_024309 [Streblomastix strix]
MSRFSSKSEVVEVAIKQWTSSVATAIVVVNSNFESLLIYYASMLDHKERSCTNCGWNSQIDCLGVSKQMKTVAMGTIESTVIGILEFVPKQKMEVIITVEEFA